jgi:hypothetical protein
MPMNGLTIEEVIGASRIYFLRNGSTFVLPIKEATNIVPWKLSYPHKYDVVLPHDTHHGKFVPGMSAYLRRAGVSDDIISEFMGLLYTEKKGFGEWAGRRAREDYGVITIDGPHPNSPAHNRQEAGIILGKADTLPSICKLVKEYCQSSD